MKTDFSPQEKQVIAEELEDVLDYYDSMIQDGAFDNEIEKEEMISRVGTIDRILQKV